MMQSLLAAYDWKATLVLIVLIAVITKAGRWLVLRVPEFRRVRDLNREQDALRLAREKYPPMIRSSVKAGMWTNAAFYLLLVPFVVDLEPRPIWHSLLDIVMILMVYDLAYYLMHRFLFHAPHDSRFAICRYFRRIHAVHHQARDPSYIDAYYVQPVETAMGQELFHLMILVLGLASGGVHAVALAVTVTIFVELNTFNHVKFEVPGRRYALLNWISFRHHVHHRDMQQGNYASIALLYDKLFGTLD